MRGNLKITTLRKLPTINPRAPQYTVKIAGSVKKGGMVRSYYLDQVAGGILSVYTTDPSINMGRYIAIIKPPTKTPSMDMIMGSISELRLSTALSTAAS